MFRSGMTVAIAVVGLIACGFNGHRGGRDTASNPSDGLINREACYTHGCLTATGGLSDPSGDYAYPDPARYPNNDLRGQYAKPKRFIQLEGLDPNLKLSPNFRLIDFMSAAKGPYAIFAPGVVNRVEQILSNITGSLTVTSAYRSPGYNRRTDGAATFSRHMYGDALDLVASHLSPSQLKQKCLDAGASFYQVYVDHIHCDWRLDRLDPAFYDATPITPASIHETYRQLSESARLIWRTSEAGIELSVHLAYLEDEGVPTHEWIVETPDGGLFMSNDPVISLPQMFGVYRIVVTVGESVTIERAIAW